MTGSQSQATQPASMPGGTQNQRDPLNFHRPRVLDSRAVQELQERRRQFQPSIQSRRKDIRQTKEYKTAARKWTSTIVALPILFYTSWILYERAFHGQSQKHLLNRDPSSQQDSTAVVLQSENQSQVVSK